MWCEWDVLPLNKAGVKLIDCVHKTPQGTEAGFPYIGIPQMKGGHIDFNAGPRVISKEDYLEWTTKAKPQENDVVLSRRCNPGEIAYVSKNTDFALGQNLVLLRADGTKVYPPFLRWVTQGPEWWEQIGKFLNVGAVFDSLRCADIPNFELSIPPLSQQKAIAHILGSLDDKIELNRRMNATLEAMAQALFKSWFVDFDPVIDNALAAGHPIPEPLQERAEARAALGDQRQPLPETIRQQFPNRFVCNEDMGWVPEGWEVSSIGKILELAYGRSLPATKRVKGSFPVYGSGGVSGFHREPLVRGPGIIVGRKGTVGSLYWEEQDFYPIDTVFYVVNKSKAPLFWVFQTLGLFDIKSMGADSAVPGVNRNTVYSMAIVLPPPHVFEEYVAIIDPNNKRRQNLAVQNESLADLRDTLLPKLLSGQLRIPEAEQQVADML